jgi:hypothetical protein
MPLFVARHATNAAVAGIDYANPAHRFRQLGEQFNALSPKDVRRLADEGFERHRKPTRREQFLDEMDRTIHWAELCAVIELPGFGEDDLAPGFFD